MDFNPILKTIQIEAQVEDSRIDSNHQKVSDARAPESHNLNLDKIASKDSVVVLSGKSKFGSKVHTVDDVLASASVSKFSKKRQGFNESDKPLIKDHSYEDSKLMADSLTSVPARQKKNSKRQRSSHDSKSEAPEEPFDPFGQEMNDSFEVPPKPNQQNKRAKLT